MELGTPHWESTNSPQQQSGHGLLRLTFVVGCFGEKKRQSEPPPDQLRCPGRAMAGGTLPQAAYGTHAYNTTTLSDTARLQVLRSTSGPG